MRLLLYLQSHCYGLPTLYKSKLNCDLIIAKRCILLSEIFEHMSVIKMAVSQTNEAQIYPHTNFQLCLNHVSVVTKATHKQLCNNAPVSF